MSLEDPYIIIKDEVFQALLRARELFKRYNDIGIPNTVESVWVSNELRNALRSIEWDLEDLEDTINIVDKDRSKFNVDDKEISNRQTFVEKTRNEVKSMKDVINYHFHQDKVFTSLKQPLLEEEEELNGLQENLPSKILTTTITGMSRYNKTKYSKLENAMDDSPGHFDDGESNGFVTNNMGLQQRMVATQDEQLDMISDSVGTLKTVSRQINMELDEQAVMLEDFGNELENTETKIDATMKKIARIFRVNNDSRQWMAIGILSVLLFIVIILLIIL